MRATIFFLKYNTGCTLPPSEALQSVVDVESTIELENRHVRRARHESARFGHSDSRQRFPALLWVDFFLLLTMPCVSLYPSISSTTCTRGVRKHRSPTLPLLHKRVQCSRQTYGTCREAPMLITTTSTTPQKNKLLVWGMKKSSEKSL